MAFGDRPYLVTKGSPFDGPGVGWYETRAEALTAIGYPGPVTD